MNLRKKITIILQLVIVQIFTSCADPDFSLYENIPMHSVLFTVNSDFSTGSYAVTDLINGQSYANIGDIHSDAYARFNQLDGKIYIINRYGRDNIQVLDPNSAYRTIREIALPAGSNPHDLVFYSLDTMFISLYNATYITILDPLTGAEKGRIDLSAYADQDGLPELSFLALVNYNSRPYLFAAMQKLNRMNQYKPAGPGQLAVIDPVTRTVLRVLTLRGQNPNSPFMLSNDGSRLHISSVGLFGYFYQLDGGIESIKLSDQEADILVEEYLISEATMSGETTQFLFIETRVAAIVTDENFNSYLRLIDPVSPANSVTLYSFSFQPGAYLSGLAYDGATLYAGSRDPLAPAILSFHIANSTRKDFSLGKSLPPFQLLLIP